MLSIDANLLLYAMNEACPQHSRAAAYLGSIAKSEHVALSEFLLSEFYVLLRNPAVLTKPLSAAEAVEAVNRYRRHPRWKIVGFPPHSQTLHDELWNRASKNAFARRRIFDVRTALALKVFGVKEFVTANVKDFEGLGFDRVWNPITSEN